MSTNDEALPLWLAGKRAMPGLCDLWGLFTLIFPSGSFPGHSSFLTCMCWLVFTWKLWGTLCRSLDFSLHAAFSSLGLCPGTLHSLSSSDLQLCLLNTERLPSCTSAPVWALWSGNSFQLVSWGN